MREKLQKGVNELAEAGHDQSRLAIALISFHSALEDYFRGEIEFEIAADEMQQGRRRTDWQELLNLWQRHRSLPQHDRDVILAKNSKRNAIAHGRPFTISRREVEQYAHFVQTFMGIHAKNPPSQQSLTSQDQSQKSPRSSPAQPQKAKNTQPPNVNRRACLTSPLLLIAVLFSICICPAWVISTSYQDLTFNVGDAVKLLLFEPERINFSEEDRQETPEASIILPPPPPTLEGWIHASHVTEN